MKKQMLHTPEGVRDIYSLEYGKKSVLEEKFSQPYRSRYLARGTRTACQTLFRPHRNLISLLKAQTAVLQGFCGVCPHGCTKSVPYSAFCRLGEIMCI